jgi:hypothetical protein
MQKSIKGLVEVQQQSLQPGTTNNIGINFSLLFYMQIVL